MTRLFLAGVCPKYRAEVEGFDLLLSYADSTQFLFCKALLRGEDFFHNFKQVRRGDRVQRWKLEELILDSGAFSIWTSRRYAGLDEAALRRANAATLAGYITELRRLVHNPSYNHGRFVKTFRYVALDVIPGAPRRISAEDVRIASELSLENLDAMRAAGLDPMPVFHEGDPRELLDRFVRERTGLESVICLASTLSRGKPELRSWVEAITRRYPDVRFHGLAMTQGWVREVGLYSVDSTTWLNEQKTPQGADRELSPAERRCKGIARVKTLVLGA